MGLELDNALDSTSSKVRLTTRGNGWKREVAVGRRSEAGKKTPQGFREQTRTYRPTGKVGSLASVHLTLHDQ